MEPVSRRNFALTAAIGAAFMPSIALAAPPVNVRSVSLLADVTGAAIASGDCLYVEGRSSLADGFEGIFVARTKLPGEVSDQVLTLSSTANPALIWERQVTNATYLSSWWVPNRSASAAACNQALNTMFARIPAADCTALICAGLYKLGDASAWEPVTLDGKTRVMVVAQSGAVFTTTGVAPRAAISAFTFPMMLIKNCHGCTVSGLAFDAAAGGQSAAGIDAFCAITSINCTFSHLEGIGFGGLAMLSEIACTGSSWEDCNAHDTIGTCRGIWLGHNQTSAQIGSYMSRDVKVSRCRATNNGATGIVIVADGATVIGNTSSDNNGSGIISPAADGYVTCRHTVMGNICERNAFYGYQTDVLSTDPVYFLDGLSVVSNIFNENLNGGMLLNKCRNVVASANICTRNGSPLPAPAAYGILAEGSCSSLLISANTCSDDRSPRIQRIGIAVHAHSGVSMSRVGVIGNVCSGHTQGINIQTISGTAAISGLNVSCNVTRSNDEGIFLAHAGQSFDDVVINGNNCRGNSVRDLRCSVAGAKVRANTYSTFLFASDVPYQMYASDSAAGIGGLKQGEEYRTATGELRVKL